MPGIAILCARDVRSSLESAAIRSNNSNDEKRTANVEPNWDDDDKLHKRLSKALIQLRDSTGLRSKDMAERLKVTEAYMSQVLH